MAFAQNQSNLRRIGLRLVSASVQVVLVGRLVMPWINPIKVGLDKNCTRLCFSFYQERGNSDRQNRVKLLDYKKKSTPTINDTILYFASS